MLKSKTIFKHQCGSATRDKRRWKTAPVLAFMVYLQVHSQAYRHNYSVAFVCR